MSKKSKEEREKLAQNKKLKRRWLTWLRMARYGANNFTRNAWLTTAATAVMTITLLIVFTTIAARTMLTDTVSDLRGKINIPIFLKSDVSDKTVDSLTSKLKKDPNVKAVKFTTSDQAREIYIKRDIGTQNVEQLQTLADSDITFPSTLDVNVRNPDNLKSLAQLVKEDDEFNSNLNEDVETRFSGDKSDAINKISEWATIAERAGLAATILFVAISMLIVFNTIRMAIFNRRDEIDMMKLIGADRSFIRGPFVVEAVMYGFIAALIATTLGYLALLSIKPALVTYGIRVDTIEQVLVAFTPLVLLGMIILGALIGIVSARLAVRRYLKL